MLSRSIRIRSPSGHLLGPTDVWNRDIIDARVRALPDRLYEAIKRAINEDVDGVEFERCVVDLLSTNYPNLRPLSGGNDAGQDGLFELPDGRRGFIVATTGQDVARNLRKSVKSHRKADGEGRVVVLATTRCVSGQMREKLKRELVQDFGFTLHDVHDQAVFIGLLYKSSRWRKNLLGVPGIAGALTRIPFIAAPVLGMPLIGREVELEKLRSAKGDLIVVGKPGIGKTFLFQKLTEEDWGLFDAQRNILELEDAIRDSQPQRVIIDDAHLVADDRIARVLHLRQEMEGDFAVVVVTWPGYLDEVKELLPGAEIVTVEELDREEIIEVINATGLMGPDELLREINDQVIGRAGLAVMLARACLSGEPFDVATGRRLLANLIHWFARSLPDPHASCAEIMGVLGLSDKTGATTAEIAAALGESESSIRKAISFLATGGTIDEVSSWHGRGERRLILQPTSLRAAAVERTFFNGPGSVDIEVAARQLPDGSSISRVLTRAALRGAQIPRETIRRYLTPVDRESTIGYSLLGAYELREAVQLAPQHEVAIATAAYSEGVGSSYALRVLLDHALGPDGPLDKDSWDPLQVISRRLHGRRGTIADRRLVIEVTDQWLTEGGNLEVGACALKHALHPGFDDSSLDPGFGDTVQIVRGIQPPEVVAQIASLWDEVLNVVSQHRKIPINPLIGALSDWFLPGRMTMDGEPRAGSELQSTMRDVGERALRRLAEMLEARPVALRALQEFALRPRVEIKMAFSLPPHIDALVPLSGFVTGYGSDWNGWEEATAAKVRALAAEVAILEHPVLARFIVNSFLELSREQVVDSLFQRLMIEIGELMNDPVDLLTELETLDAPWECRAHFVERIAVDQEAGWEEMLATYIKPDDSWPAVLLALRHPVGHSTKRAAVQRIDGRHASGIQAMIIRDELDDATLGLMLGSSDLAVAAHVAVTLGSSDGMGTRPTRSEKINQQWREVVIALCVSGDSTYHDHWRYSEIFERDQTLLILVIERWFDIFPSSPLTRLPFRIEESVANLPLDTRLKLISRIPEGASSPAISSTVEALVSDDLEATRALFDRMGLRKLHRFGLAGEPSTSWLERALVAMDHGWNTKEVVASSLPSHGVWWGRDSAQWQKRVDAFEKLRTHASDLDDLRVDKVIDAGIEQFSSLRDSALAEERQEHVFGRGVV